MHAEPYAKQAWAAQMLQRKKPEKIAGGQLFPFALPA